MRQKRQLSYFLLKLEEYLSDYHLDKLQEKAFTKARAEEALTVYFEAIEQGYDHLQAEELASKTLYKGLHFSAYDTIRTILENEFATGFQSHYQKSLHSSYSVVRQSRRYCRSTSSMMSLTAHLSMSYCTLN